MRRENLPSSCHAHPSLAHSLSLAQRPADPQEGLLSLIGDVTDSKESVRQSKLDKHRSYQGEAAPPVSGSNSVKKKEVTPTEKRKREKDRALVSGLPSRWSTRLMAGGDESGSSSKGKGEETAQQGDGHELRSGFA